MPCAAPAACGSVGGSELTSLSKPLSSLKNSPGAAFLQRCRKKRKKKRRRGGEAEVRGDSLTAHRDTVRRPTPVAALYL